MHHDTASARSWVQLRVRIVACTAVDDPPPKLDDGRKLAGDLDGSCQAFRRFLRALRSLLRAIKEKEFLLLRRGHGRVRIVRHMPSHHH